ncbi:PilZ domain-containing protein [Hydrogenimonas sp.]
MILPKESEAYERVYKQERVLLPLYPFFKRYKERFETHFLDEIRKEIGSSRMREALLQRLSSEFYDALFNFKAPVPEGVAEAFLQLKNRGVPPLLLLQKLLASLILRLVNDYADDRDLFGYLRILSDYFDQVMEYLKSLLQAETDRDFATHVALKPDEIERWLPPGRPVHLLNIYKGIPIPYEAVVNRSRSGSIVLQMPLERGVVAEREGRVVLYDRRMEPFAVTMELHKMAYRGKIAIAEVENPAWIDSIAHRRKRVRVKLSTPIKARITALGRQFNVDVVDLSGKGVCLQTDVEYGLPLYEQVEVTLPIPQPDGSLRSIVMRGTLQYISTPDSSLRRYHILLHANPRKEEILSSFVARRELDLLREIKAIAKKRES